MNDLKKTSGSLKDKFDVARSVELPPASPLVPATPDTKAAPETRVPFNSSPPKSASVSLPFTFAFQQSDYPTAMQLAARIGCKLEDMLLLVAKRFDEQTLNLAVTNITSRSRPSKRVLLKISQTTIDQIRQIKDPLHIRSDGYLLRAPVLAALDQTAILVLSELAQRYALNPKTFSHFSLIVNSAKQWERPHL